MLQQEIERISKIIGNSRADEMGNKVKDYVDWKYIDKISIKLSQSKGIITVRKD